nr:hypothetical protein [Tanacetum cinerariifolium]
MSGTISPSPGASSRNTRNPNRPGTSSRNAGNPNRVEDVFQTNNTNNTGTNNVALNVVNEDLPQFLDSRRASRLKFNAFKALEGEKIYEAKTQRFTIQSSTSKALISNTCTQVSDSDVEEDTRSTSEHLANLNADFHDRALLANQKRFYKRSRRVGSARKSTDK